MDEEAKVRKEKGEPEPVTQAEGESAASGEK